VALRVGGRTLLERHHEVLLEAGVTDVRVVVGHAQGELERIAAGLARVRTLQTPEPATTGSGYSLHLALEAIAGEGGPSGDGVVFMDGDIVHARTTLEPLLRREGDLVLVGDGDEDDAEAVKVLCRGARVTALGKSPDPSAGRFDGESVGVVRLSPSGLATLLDETRRRVGSGRRDFEWEHALEAILSRQRFDAVRAGGPSLSSARRVGASAAAGGLGSHGFLRFLFLFRPNRAYQAAGFLGHPGDDRGVPARPGKHDGALI
jgi:choline kinase